MQERHAAVSESSRGGEISTFRADVIKSQLKVMAACRHSKGAVQRKFQEVDFAQWMQPNRTVCERLEEIADVLDYFFCTLH